MALQIFSLLVFSGNLVRNVTIADPLGLGAAREAVGWVAVIFVHPIGVNTSEARNVLLNNGCQF